MYTSPAIDVWESLIVWMIHIENSVSYQSILLVLNVKEANIWLRQAKAKRSGIGGVTGRYERDTQTVHKANEPRSYRPVHLYSRHFWLYLARIILLVVSLSPFLMYLRRYSSPPLNERLIPCPSVLFCVSSSEDRLPAYLLARTVTPSHQHLCFPLYRPVTSLLPLRGVPILSHCVSWTFFSPLAS